MPPYIPYSGGALGPIDRNVYQAYDNPYSPDNVRKQMGFLYAPPTSYYGLDSQGNRKRFMFDNGQLANQAEKMLGSQEAAMLQDARLKKVKNDMAFLQSLRGGMASPQGGGFSPSQFPQAGQPLAFDPTPGAYGPPGTYVPPGSTILDSGMRNPTGGTVPLIIPQNIQRLLPQQGGGSGAGPNVFGTPQNEQDVGLQKLLQGRVNAENLGQQYFAAGIEQTRRNRLTERQRQIEDKKNADAARAAEDQHQMAQDKLLNDQADKLAYQANAINSREKIAQAALDAKTQQNFQRALNTGAITNEGDIKQFFGNRPIDPQEMAIYRGQLNQANNQFANKLGTQIASGEITNAGELQGLEGGRLSSDQYAPLQNALWNQQANQFKEYAAKQAPGIDALTEGMAKATKTPFANYQATVANPSGFWNGLRSKIADVGDYWNPRPDDKGWGSLSVQSMLGALRPSGSSPEEIAAAKANIDKAAQQYAAGALVNKQNAGIEYNPTTRQFEVRPPVDQPYSKYDMNFYDWMNAGKPVYGPPEAPGFQRPVENVTRTGTINGQPGPYQAPPPYTPDPYRFGGRPDYVSDPTHFGGTPLPPMYGPPVAPQMATMPAPAFANDGTRLVRSDAEFESLQPGTVFIGIDGRKRRKP